MHPFVEIAAAVAFVASSGLFFNERFRRNYIAVGVAGVIATVATVFLLRELSERWSGGSQSSRANLTNVTIRSLDQIGALRKTETFDGSVNLGMSRGVPTCYFEEIGDTHRLDIGINKEGAFARLHDHGDYQDAMPVPPLHVFVGERRVDENNKVTGDYLVRAEYKKPVEYIRHRTGFMLLARASAVSFFEWLVQARRKFIVVQSIEHRWSNEIVAVYHFDSRVAASLVSCARSRLGFTEF